MELLIYHLIVFLSHQYNYIISKFIIITITIIMFIMFIIFIMFVMFIIFIMFINIIKK